MTESRSHILVLSTTVPASPGDGTPEFVLDLSRELAREHRVTLLAPRVDGAPAKSVEGGVEILRFAYLPRRWETLAAGAILPNLRARPWWALQVPFLIGAFLFHALRTARRLKPDVIHAHWILPAGLIALMLRRRHGIPYLVTVHGGDAYSLRGRTATFLKRSVLRHASFVGAVSADVASVLPYRHPRTAIIPMGIPLRPFAETTPSAVTRPGEFLFVGRLAEKKGVDTLIRSLEGIEDGRLTIAGDGPEAARLRSLAESLELTERVRFLGRVRRDALPDLYRAAHAVVIPSVVAADGDKDGTPLVMAEAMAAGRLVIASDLGGLSEHIEHGSTGILVRPGSVENLRDALMMAVADPDAAASIGSRARLYMLGGPLDARITGARYIEEIEVILRERPRSGTAGDESPC